LTVTRRIHTSVTHPRVMSLVYRRHDSFTQRPTATHCNTLQHTATQIAKYLTSPQELECACTHTQCNTVQYTATHFNTNCEILDFAAVIGGAHAHTHPHTHTLQNNSTNCNPLYHTATHCNTLQPTVSHCNTLQHISTHCHTNCEILDFDAIIGAARAHTNAHTSTLTYSPLQPTATHCNPLQPTATHCNPLQPTISRNTKCWISPQELGLHSRTEHQCNSHRHPLQLTAT